jgi:hypothetical protein
MRKEVKYKDKYIVGTSTVFVKVGGMCVVDYEWQRWELIVYFLLSIANTRVKNIR